MYDDLHTLMREATQELSPPAGAASRALRAAAKSRRRTAYLAGTGTVAAVGLVAAGTTAILRSGTRVVYAAGQPSYCSTIGEVEASQPATLRGLSLPDTLPGFPVNLWSDPATDSQPHGGPGRLWGWDAAHYRDTPLGKGAVMGTPVGPQLRLGVIDKPNVYALGTDGRVAGRDVDGALSVRCHPALVSHDADDLYVTLTYGQFSISAMGGNGASVSDLVMTVDAIAGLDGKNSAGTFSPPTQEPRPTAFAGLHAPQQGLPRPSAGPAETPSSSPSPSAVSASG